jgi:hypothetical protein
MDFAHNLKSGKGEMNFGFSSKKTGKSLQC